MAQRSRLIALALVLIVATAGFLLWREHGRAERAEAEVGLAAARTLSAVFERTSALKVAQLSGEVLARAESTSALGMIATEQTTRAPYTVDYFVDLRPLTPAAMRWNAKAKVVTVDIPEVAPARANIDMAQARTVQRGVYISRAAGQAMQTATAVRLAGAAAAKAHTSENLGQAREAARVAVARLVAAPLAAAGHGDVTVTVRLPGEAKPAGLADEQWDRSRSIEEVLAAFPDRE